MRVGAAVARDAREMQGLLAHQMLCARSALLTSTLPFRSAAGTTSPLFR